MTNATVLADALVEDGLAEVHIRSITHVRVYRLKGTTQYCSAETLIELWDVAGKVLRSMRKQGCSWLLHSMPDGKALMTLTSPLPDRKEWDAQVVDDNDARAIIEAWYEARQ